MLRAFFVLLIACCPAGVAAQQIPLNRYGLPVVNNLKTYLEIAAKDSNQVMVDLQQYIPGIAMKIFYATSHNFTHQVLYPEARIFLRLPAAAALKAAEDDLKKQGLGLLIFDAYRPYVITEKMWTVVPDDRYAADPKHGSGHNRGIAVDLTLVDLKTKQPLQMPTEFDNFTPKAHRDYTDLPTGVIARRQLLENIMVKYGFVPLSTEWWHFSLPEAQSYPLMNISFKALDSLQRLRH